MYLIIDVTNELYVGHVMFPGRTNNEMLRLIMVCTISVIITFRLYLLKIYLLII